MKKRLLFVILAVHAAILLGLTCFEIVSPIQKEKKKLEVQTVILNPHPHVKDQHAKEVSAKPVANQPKKTVKIAKADKKEKKVTKKSKPATQTVKKDSTLKNQQIEKMLNEALSSIDQVSSHKPNASFAKIEQLNSEKIENASESYGARLKDFLQKMLIFPETGEVKIKLYIQSNGHILHFSVLSTSSEKNRNYIESVLPTLVLPESEKNEDLIVTLTDACQATNTR